MLQVTIEMSLPVYDAFIEKCDPASREYSILKNGVILRSSDGDHPARTMKILCTMEDADKLLFSASGVCPEAVEDIARAIADALKLPDSGEPS